MQRILIVLKTMLNKLSEWYGALSARLDETIYENSPHAAAISSAKMQLSQLESELRVPIFRKPEETQELKNRIEKLTCYLQGLQGLALSGKIYPEPKKVDDGLEVLEKKVVEEMPPTITIESKHVEFDRDRGFEGYSPPAGGSPFYDNFSD